MGYTTSDCQLIILGSKGPIVFAVACIAKLMLCFTESCDVFMCIMGICYFINARPVIVEFLRFF